MRKNLWDEQFNLKAKNSSAWALEARRLKRAADLVFEAYAADLHKLVNDESPLTLRNLEIAGVATLLYGLAFENLFKARIIEKAPKRVIENDKLSNWFVGHHDLDARAPQGGVRLSPAQSDLLARLSAYVQWAGKYPIPKAAERIPLKQAGVFPDSFPLPVQSYEHADVVVSRLRWK